MSKKEHMSGGWGGSSSSSSSSSSSLAFYERVRPLRFLSVTHLKVQGSVSSSLRWRELARLLLPSFNIRKFNEIAAIFLVLIWSSTETTTTGHTVIWDLLLTIVFTALLLGISSVT